MPNELYRDFIDGKADEIVTALGGTITPPPANSELYRDFLDRKFDDVINAIGNGKLVKTFDYTGDGTTPLVLKFPEKPTLYAIYMQSYVNNTTYTDVVTIYNKTVGSYQTSTGTNMVRQYFTASWDNNTNELTLTPVNAINLNSLNVKYYVFYI